MRCQPSDCMSDQAHKRHWRNIARQARIDIAERARDEQAVQRTGAATSIAAKRKSVRVSFRLLARA